MDLRVVPLAQQRGVLQRRLPLVQDPFEDMVDVAPVTGCLAAGEHAVPVAGLDRPPQVGRDQPDGAPQVQRLPLRAEGEPGDRPVAGRPAGPGGGEDRAEPGLGSGRSGRRVEQILDADGDQQMRLDGPQERQPARPSSLSTSWTSASPSCWARVRRSPFGRFACTIDSSAACSFSPPTASSSPRIASLPSSSRERVSDRPSVGSGSGPSGSSRARKYPTTRGSCANGRVVATSVSVPSTSARSTPCPTASACTSTAATGATTATCSAVTDPAANAARSTGS